MRVFGGVINPTTPGNERTFEGRETTAEDQFQVAKLSLTEDDSRQSLSLCCKLLVSGKVSCKEISVDLSATAPHENKTITYFNSPPWGGLAMVADVVWLYGEKEGVFESAIEGSFRERRRVQVVERSFGKSIKGDFGGNFIGDLGAFDRFLPA